MAWQEAQQQVSKDDIQTWQAEKLKGHSLMSGFYGVRHPPICPPLGAPWLTHLFAFFYLNSLFLLLFLSRFTLWHGPAHASAPRLAPGLRISSSISRHRFGDYASYHEWIQVCAAISHDSQGKLQSNLTSLVDSETG